MRELLNKPGQSSFCTAVSSATLCGFINFCFETKLIVFAGGVKRLEVRYPLKMESCLSHVLLFP